MRWNEKPVDILRDIAEMVEGDREHNVKIEIGLAGMTVYLDYDPEQEYEETMMVPICYDTMEGFAYIPQDEFIDKYHPNDFGLDVSEIILIGKIMTYLEEHKEYINELCGKYCVKDRESIEELVPLEDEVKAGLLQ